MSLLPGSYFIVSTFEAEALAVNFDGPSLPLTVAKYEEASFQVWDISSPTDGLQGISPANAQGQYVIFGDDHELTTGAGSEGIIWSFKAVKGGDNEYTIETKDGEHIWDLQVAEEGKPVTWQSIDDVHNDVWKFIPVPIEKGTDLD